MEDETVEAAAVGRDFVDGHLVWVTGIVEPVAESGTEFDGDVPALDGVDPDRIG